MEAERSSQQPPLLVPAPCDKGRWDKVLFSMSGRAAAEEPRLLPAGGRVSREDSSWGSS